MRKLLLLVALALLALPLSGRALADGLPADWTEAVPPFKIAGNLYYVGTRGLASYLVATPEGHILINTNLEAGLPALRGSIEKLGFKVADVKVLLISHAHFDHDEASALLKKQTGARYMVMDGDVAVVESGGKADFQYPDHAVPAVKVDRVLHDGDKVELGGTTLVAHLTPGHTRGCTTWTMRVTEGGKSYDAVIVGSPNVNDGYRLVGNERYPQIADDYERMWRVLKSLPCDFFLGAHGSYFDMDAKLARAKPGAPSPLIDPDGYRKFVADKETEFRRKLEAQRAEAKAAGR